MSTAEKTFTIVGTAVNLDGNRTVRWGNSMTQRLGQLIRNKCTEIDLHEMPVGLTKLEGAKWYLENVDLNPDQEFTVQEKINDKKKQAKRTGTKKTIQENIEANVKENKETDPRVAEFINKTLETAETN